VDRDSADGGRGTGWKWLNLLRGLRRKYFWKIGDRYPANLTEAAVEFFFSADSEAARSLVPPSCVPYTAAVAKRKTDEDRT
jgi:hypothetical protein